MNNKESLINTESKVYKAMLYCALIFINLKIVEFGIAIHNFIIHIVLSFLFIAPSWFFGVTFFRNYPFIGIGLASISAAYLIYIHIVIYLERTDR